MKPIPEYEGYYSAEEDGRIFSHKTNEYLTPNYNRRYLKFTLCKDGVRKDKDVHRLIAMTFIPNPDNKPTVDHIDQNKHNNRVSNLRWATSQENSSNLPIYKTNTSGHKNIFVQKGKWKDTTYIYYRVEFVRGGNVVFTKNTIKTLEEAVKIRDEYLKTL
jgi:hypothetical protein